MSENTLADLRREVAARMRETLHGKEIDTMEKGMPETPHMLGIVTIGAISTDEAIKGSILDPEHGFWSNYYKDVNTFAKAKSEVESAMHSLSNDETFRVSTPYGEDAGIWYCEVDDIGNSKDSLMTTCSECGAEVFSELQLSNHYDMYRLEVKLDCPECDFEKKLSTQLHSR